MRSQTHITFWQGVIDPLSLVDDEAHGAVISAKLEMLAQGRSKSADLDLKSNGIYGIRLNKQHRLFVMTYEHQEQPCLLLLGIDTKHNYRQNILFRPRGVANFIQKHLVYDDPTVVPLKNFILQAGGASAMPEEPVFEPMAELHQVGADPYVMLTEKQETIATKALLPVVVRGVAGSGKTISVMLAMARQAKLLAASAEAGERKPIVRLVCKSGALAKKIEHDFKDANPDGIPGVSLEFRAYKSLYQGDAQPVDFACFEKWLKLFTFTRKQKSTSKYSDVNKSIDLITEHCLALQYINKKNKNIAQLIYNEFKIVACDTQAYCDSDFGKRQCRLQTLEAKQALVTIFERYLQYLTKADTPKIDFSLMSFALPEEMHCDALIVEEGQLVTGKEFETMLAALNNKQQVLMSCDTHQATTDILSLNMHLVRQNFAKFGYSGDITEVELDKSFRVSSCVAQAAEASLVKMNQVINGVTEVGLYTSVKTPMTEAVASGHVVWIKDTAQAEQSKLQQLANQPTTLVIAADADSCEQARQQWGDDINVESAYDCGGLEYSTVIIHSLPKVPLKRMAVAYAHGSGKKASRPKDYLSPFRFEQQMLQWRLLYTMITRSSDQLVVLGKRAIYSIFEPYQQSADNQIRIKQLSVKQEQQAWLEIVSNYLYEGKTQLAEHRYVAHKLQALTQCDFTAFQKQCIPEKPVVEKAVKLSQKQSGGGSKESVKQMVFTKAPKPTLSLLPEPKSMNHKSTPVKKGRGKKQNKPIAPKVKLPELNYVVTYTEKRKRHSIDFSTEMTKTELKQLKKPFKGFLKKVKKHHVLALLCLPIANREPFNVRLNVIINKESKAITLNFLKKIIGRLKDLDFADQDLLNAFKIDEFTWFFDLLNVDEQAGFRFFYEALGERATLVLLSIFSSRYKDSLSLPQQGHMQSSQKDIPSKVQMISSCLCCGYYDFVDLWMAHKKIDNSIFSDPDYFKSMTVGARFEDLKYALGRVEDWQSFLNIGHDSSAAESPLEQLISDADEKDKKAIAELILNCVPKDYLDKEKYLNLAIECNLLDFAKRLVEEMGADVDTGIEAALNSPNSMALQYLIAAKANIQDKSGFYLYDAIDSKKDSIEKIKVLLAAKADPNFQPDDLSAKPAKPDWRALRVAAKQGNIDMVDVLLAHKADVGPDQSYKSPPLLCAIIENHTTVVERLLAAKAPIEEQALLLPLHDRQHDILQLVINAKADVNSGYDRRDSEDERSSYLGLALEKRDVKALQILVSAKADLNKAPDKKNIIQQNIWGDAQRSQIVPLLCEAGANINLPIGKNDDGQFTILHQAAFQGDIDGVQLLLDCKADPRGVEGCPPPIIFAACGQRNNSMAVCRQLVDAKADPNAKNHLDQTALSILSAGTKMTSAQIAYRLKSLVEMKASYSHCEQNALSEALYYAIQYDRAEVVSELLRNGVIVNDGTISHFDIAHAARDDVDISLVQLLQAKADLNSKDDQGQTVLDGIMLISGVEDLNKRRVPCMESLVAHKADYSQCSQRNFDSALVSAFEQQDILFIDTLLAAKVALSEGMFSVLQIYELAQRDSSLIERLVAAKVDINSEDDSHDTALTMAVNQGNQKVVKKLLAVSANPNHRVNGSEGLVPLCAAIQYQDVKMVKSLLQAKADPHLSGPNRNVLEFALFSIASKFKHRKGSVVFDQRLKGLVIIVQALVKAKADPGGSIKKAYADERFICRRIGRIFSDDEVHNPNNQARFFQAMSHRFGVPSERAGGGKKVDAAAVSANPSRPRKKLDPSAPPWVPRFLSATSTPGW